MEVEVSGRADGPLMVFVHGWPDDPHVWTGQTKHFRKTHRCATVSLPGFGHKRLTDPAGYNFDQLARMLAQTVEGLQRGESDRAVLVLHDWGCVIGFTAQDLYPELFAGVIAFDVGPPTLDMPRFRDAPALFTIGMIYQYVLIWAYLLFRASPHGVGERIGNWLSRSVARRLGAPNPEQALAMSNYPYYYFHTNFLTELFGGAGRIARYGKKPSSPQTAPTLYIYGVQKSVMLHSARWVQTLKDSPDCHVIPVKCGHWIMCEVPAEEINRKMSNFIDLNIPSH
ncbi:Epoxide hydrolase 1 [Hondaea fermentalgiana]|uniref:Epoxide hydrolase 1 n=1 Tax=Hondaea fermentalgiana TaxID=2315210 RepID=A0A2R5GKR4_9STRA|nr:Epoxide hydrolase 1 [Hondaea fermentalgiana]|eukprot:GBG28464.1 Epoxide hydrolase 1 [Hondaea fermentalgiana]